MDQLQKLTLCAAFVEETGLAYRLEREGENGNPFDLLYLPEFQQTPDERAAPMHLSVFFAKSKYAFMDQMEFDLLHLLGDIGRVARPGTVRELRALLGEINFQMPVGAFDVDEEGALFLRYTLPLPREMEDAAFLRQFGIAFSLLNSFALAFLKPIFAVVRGERTAKSAMDLARQELNTLYDALHQIGADKNE